MMLKLIATVLALTFAAEAPAETSLPSTLDLDTIRAIPVQHDGRWPPLDTVARDTVESVTGDVFYQGHDPVLLLFAWTFDSQSWMQAPLFRIGNEQLRAELHLPATQSTFSYSELISHKRLRLLIEQLSNIEKGRKPDPLESKVGDINGRLITLQRVFQNRVIRPIPHPNDVLGAWRPIAAARGTSSAELTEVVATWKNLRESFLADDGAAFTEVSGRLATSIAALPAAHRPSAQHIAVELRYNTLQPFRTAWQAMVASAVLAAAAIILRRKWFDAIAITGMVVGFTILTYGLSMRWQIAGRIPASNMFESLLFLSWGMGAFAILSMLFMSHRIVPLTASAMGALSLVLADCLPLDNFIRPIAPVLMDTVWMSIHVPIIMVSYSVLALAVVIAHLQLITMAAAPGRRSFINTIDSLHYWYVHVGALLLLVGIVTGSMWAASSWGRYWGWDPKEVWSLVALLGYLAILHVRIDHERIPRWAYAVAALLGVALFALLLPKLAPLTGLKVLALLGTAAAMALFVLARGQFATALKSILAFWLIIMTYVGVNFVLGTGLHSYAFGSGAVAHYMFQIGGIDLALVGVCVLIYLARTRLSRSRPTTGLPIVAPA